MDPFGRAEVRKVERQLPREYLRTIDALLPRLSDSNLDKAVEIAQLPELVRGYEQIKLDNVERYRERVATLLGEFLASAPHGHLDDGVQNTS